MDTELNIELLESLWQQFVGVLPKILGGILFLIVGWLVLKGFLYAVKKGLAYTKVDKLAEKFNENNPMFGGSVKIVPSKIVLTFVKWFLILVFIIVGADMLGLTVVSNQVGQLINFLPRIFSAVAIFFIGAYGAALVRKSITSMLKGFDLNGSKSISTIVFYILIVMVFVMALDQAGIDTEIITNNLFLILGAFLAAFTIALGLGSRDIIYRLMLGFYSRKNFEVGQRIRIDGEEGTILAIDNICMVIKIGETKQVYPIKQVSNKKIEIIS
ncbi:mechanosensitive ion channel family protein [Sediminicola luteus]|uniref:Small-conductance mechanosensitive channel n=1 Tax=Sediminicola luteus TaxID=319238 RepID=A0A2A4GA22_9FLAO|nr:mechanosensitive ion channel [Sediminicola luteus]PCE64814.1 small-conductance mechanosensitive channel [Sediminicola luteus]